MDNSIGSKIKILAIVQAIVVVLGGIIAGVNIGESRYYSDGLGFLVALGAIVAATVSGLLMYGFGELVDRAISIDEKISGTALSAPWTIEQSDANPDLRPSDSESPAAPQAPYNSKKTVEEDLSQDFIICPACQYKQHASRKSCYKCKISFLENVKLNPDPATDADPKVPENSQKTAEVDRSGDFIICPVCQYKQHTIRKNCYKCKINFVDKQA